MTAERSAAERIYAPPGDVPPRSVDTAGEFSDAAYLREQGPTPDAGWRRLVYDWSRHRVNPGPSARQRREEAVRELVRRPVPGCRRVAVVARKGGVGKTTVTLGIGHMLAATRPDRTVAVDANPDTGTLGYRMPTVGGGSIVDLVREGEQIRHYSDARRYTAFAPSRLEVIASEDDPGATEAVRADDYLRAVSVLERHYNLVLTDTGSDITHDSTRAVLDVADQIVVVVAPTLDGARAAAQTLDWLDHHGHAHLAAQAVAVLNGVPPRSAVDLERICAHFTGRVRVLERVPRDPHLETGGNVDPQALQPATHQAFLRIAAAVVDGLVAEGQGVEPVDDEARTIVLD